MHKFQSRKSLLRCPSQGDLDVWRLPGLRPGPQVFVASTAAPLESRSSAAATWPLSAALRSGVAPQALFPVWPLRLPAVRQRRGRCAVGGRRKWWACGASYPFNRQRNDERFGLHIFKTVQGKKNIHKRIEKAHPTSFKDFHGIFSATLTLPAMKRYAIVFPMRRPLRTMSSHMSLMGTHMTCVLHTDMFHCDHCSRHVSHFEESKDTTFPNIC